MSTHRTSRVPNQINHDSRGGNRRVWDGAPPPSTLLSGFEVMLSRIKIGFTDPGLGVGDDLRLRYRPEAECISFEGLNSRGMLVPLEEMLLEDNLDGTLSVFFRRQFRRKVWHHIITQGISYDTQYDIVEGPSRVCDHIQAYKNELNLELHMLCFVAGYNSLNSTANFVRRVKQGRQNIPLTQHSTDFPAYSTYRHPQPHINIPTNSRDFHSPVDHPQSQYRHSSYYSEPEMAEQYPDASTVGSAEGPRVRFWDHPPSLVSQPLQMQSRTPLRSGAGRSGSLFQEYEYEEKFARDPRDPQSTWNPMGDGFKNGNQSVQDPQNLRNESIDRERNEPRQPPSQEPREYRRPRESRSRNRLRTENGGGDGFGSPAFWDFQPPRSWSAVNRGIGGLFELSLPLSTPQPQKRMFALVFKKSPADQGVEIRPASIDSSHETLMRKASTHWNLRELRLYGHVDGLKTNLNSQTDLEAYVKLCNGVQRLMVDVE